MGNAPIEENRNITELKMWLERAGINRLSELAKWNARGEWEGWDFYGVPDRLKQQQSLLEEQLEDAAPVHKATRDSWGWGPSGVYSTAMGYKVMQGK